MTNSALLLILSSLLPGSSEIQSTRLMEHFLKEFKSLSNEYLIYFFLICVITKLVCPHSKAVISMYISFVPFRVLLCIKNITCSNVLKTHIQLGVFNLRTREWLYILQTGKYGMRKWWVSDCIVSGQIILLLWIHIFFFVSLSQSKICVLIMWFIFLYFVMKYANQNGWVSSYFQEGSPPFQISHE